MSLKWDFTNRMIKELTRVDNDLPPPPPAVDKSAASLRELQARLDRLSMICQAMWELLRDKAKLTDEDVIKQMQVIDLRDGVEDGKMTRQTLVCPECGRNVSSRREQCLYCGTWLVKNNLFE